MSSGDWRQASSRSVMPARAETTMTAVPPSSSTFAASVAIFGQLSASATELPPNFITRQRGRGVVEVVEGVGMDAWWFFEVRGDYRGLGGAMRRFWGAS